MWCLQVLGNMKGVIAAAISIALFKNPVTAKGMLGYFITVCGVVAYSEVRAEQQWAAVTVSNAGSLRSCMLQVGAAYGYAVTAGQPLCCFRMLACMLCAHVVRLLSCADQAAFQVETDPGHRQKRVTP